MRGAQYNHRPSIASLLALCRGKANRGMRIDDDPGVLVTAGSWRPPPPRCVTRWAEKRSRMGSIVAARNAEAATLAQVLPLRRSRRRRPARSPRTAAARNCLKSEYPCSGYRSASRRAARNGQFPACAQGCRSRWSRSQACPTAGPFLRRRSPRKISPKFPVGTVKLGWDSGPSFSVAV